MIVEENKVVEITYDLRENDLRGELLERMDVNYPFKFFFGNGRLLPAFEEHLYGLAEGDAFEFTLPPEAAYGPRYDNNIIDVPRDVFSEVPNAVVEGNFVALTDDHGETHRGRVLTFSDAAVRVDFNHAMAGKTLHFRGAILHIRPATVDELVRRHYIEADGVHNRDFQD